MSVPIAFIPIDLEQFADLCVQFRRDAMQCSFENGADRFDQESGENHEQYFIWLKERIQEFPEGCVHVVENDQIVGQIEMHLKGQQTLAYVNLVYLIPEVRGTGLGDQLHRYVEQIFEQVGIVKAQLSVSPINERAMSFYRKHGWQDMGPRPGYPEVHLMEFTVNQ
ncbi:MAG: GNAT family N-acetyltransferase [Cyanobacteria bacterium P01_G01_bin.38]